MRASQLALNILLGAAATSSKCAMSPMQEPRRARLRQQAFHARHARQEDA